MIERVLVGVDGSPGPSPAVETAAELADSFGAELMVLRVRPVLDPYAPVPVIDLREPEGPTAGLAGRFPRLRILTTDTEGPAVDSICSLAEDQVVDLIVVPGGTGRFGTGGLGRQAVRRVVRRAHCPVVVV